MMKKWLARPEVQDALSRTARSVMAYARTKSLSPAFLSQEGGWHEGRDDIWEDIRSELILFILENRSGIQKILISGNRNSHHYLRKAFINHWIEKTRKPLEDPQRYLYKHAADVLRNSDAFHTFSKRNRALTFSMGSDSLPIPPLSEEDMREVRFPDQSLAYESVNKKKVLLELAACFLNQVSKMWGKKAVCVELRDFVTWIGRHVAITQPVPVRESRWGEDLLALVPDRSSTTDDICFDPDQVKKWACHFSNRLGEKERAVFMLRHCQHLSLRDIAGKLGYKGSSGPKYPLDRAEDKLRFFLSDLPWLSPGDLNKEAFALFHDTLCEESAIGNEGWAMASFNESRHVVYGQTQIKKEKNAMYSRKQALARAKRYRTCPSAHIADHLDHEAEMRRHLDICPYCSLPDHSAQVMEDQRNWENLTKLIQDILPPTLGRADQEVPLSGQLRHIRSDLGGWRDGYFYNPPLVLVLEEDGGHSGEILVAQTYHDSCLAALGDLILSPDQTGADELFVECWNTYIIDASSLDSLAGEIRHDILEGVRKLQEDPVAHLEQMIQPKPLTADDSRIHFRELEAEVSGRFRNLIKPKLSDSYQ